MGHCQYLNFDYLYISLTTLLVAGGNIIILILQASDQPFCLDAGKIDKKMAERIDGELLYLSGASFFSSTILNKTVAKTLKNETHVYTEEDARFIHGHGVAYRN